MFCRLKYGTQIFSRTGDENFFFWGRLDGAPFNRIDLSKVSATVFVMTLKSFASVWYDWIRDLAFVSDMPERPQKSSVWSFSGIENDCSYLFSLYFFGWILVNLLLFFP